MNLIIDHQQGKKALTHWRVLERLTHSTRLELNPITGRSHQLRVHMLSMQHPIIGDSLYAHNQALSMADRLNLHAMFLSFRHPVTEKTLRFESQVPF